MTIVAGFAEIEITPPKFPVRTYFASANTPLDPLYAHAAVFRHNNTTLAFLSLDVVIVEREYVEKIRCMVSQMRPEAAVNLMISATHNHACPAVVDRPGSDKDDEYLEYMMARGVEAVVRAYDSIIPVEIGSRSGYENRISFNRRYVRKNGTVISEPEMNTLTDDLLYNEGIIDPAVGVLVVRDLQHRILGLLVNFSCHAVHHMGEISGGYPGVLCRKIKEEYGLDCVTVFINGACGNVIHRNWADPDQNDLMETTGGILAEDVKMLISKVHFSSEVMLAARSVTIPIQYREIEGFAQQIDQLERFNVLEKLIRKGWYKYSLEKLRVLHAIADHEAAEIQVFRIGDIFIGSVPAEYFAQNALRIKELSPATTWVASLTNGWLGYIPHPGAFDRCGGHETTWAIWSKMAPEAGEQLGNTIIELIKELHS